MQTYLKSTLICAVLISSCATYESPKEVPTAEYGSAFSKAQTLILASDYENALPFIKRSLESENANYHESLLLAARAYDQLGQPEQAILSLQEYLKQTYPVKELTARSLLLKNQSKIKLDITRSDEKKNIQRLTQNLSKQIALDSLSWSLDFRCDQYCLEEIAYFKEIQLILLYIVEQNDDASVGASELIRTRYSFFRQQLESDKLDSIYKKTLATKLYDSLKKLKSLDLVYTKKNVKYPSKALLISLAPLEKDLESWRSK